MAGIYLHIPFCKKACHYCDFHFTTSPLRKDEMIASLRKELTLQSDFFDNALVETIYFGGGTPSLLSADEIKWILGDIHEIFPISPNPEITLEANPDDLNPQKVRELKNTLINRFSIGIQSFFDEDLVWMNRAHNTREAEASVKRVQDAGFENITADLIYGYPLLTNEKWHLNIEQLTSFGVPHISAYSMTVEPATALASFIRKGKQQAMNEAQSAEQFLILMESLKEAGFEHYEISNFAKPGWHSRHNSNYWNGIPYLGIGPSAHSFKANVRQWNVANNTKYIESIGAGLIPADKEELSEANRINEYIMTSLRTEAGMDLQRITTSFGNEYRLLIENELQQFCDKNWISQDGARVTLTTDGKLYADHIASDLFVE
ncbi:radical SAM family heme chaperone HemW [Flavihumibacter sp. R14]|nr:radical SAM family heme chaperone HemW [Flavihumibacter soli]